MRSEKEEANRALLVDGHSHFEELDDLPKSLQEAKEAGIIGIIGVGMNIESNKKILQIAEANTRYVYPALGYHPRQIKDEEVEASLSFIRDHVEEGAALGEIGLDYKIKVKKGLQWRVFEELLDIARESNKPVIIHCRYSHKRAFEMVKERMIEKALFHWYSGSVDLLDEILSRGHFSDPCFGLQSPPPRGNQAGTDREDSAGDGHTRKLPGKRGKTKRCASILGGSSQA
jgi:TatD DNase family protein